MVPEHKAIHIAPQTFIIAALMILLIPIPWFVGCILAAIIHELFHCFAVLLLGGRIHYAEIGSEGAVLGTGQLSYLASAICSLSGPLGGFLLCLFADKIPHVATCGFVQSIFNLLPVYPLDGGHALHSLSRVFFSEKKATKICEIIESITISFIILTGIAASLFFKLGVVPILLTVAFLLRVKKLKFPCK